MDGRALDSEMEALLEHATWVQELAYRLVRDPAQADDIVQETWVAALAERSQPLRSTRAWLALVVQRLVWQRYRGEGRRRAREEGAARPEATASTGELFERMSAHRRVVEAVMALPATYRDVLLRRYFEGETPTEIAAAQGIPVSTVKTRLQRGLARLRGELDEEQGGDGSSWALALAPLLRAREAALRSASLSAPSLGSLALAGWLAGLVALLGVSLYFARDGDDERRPARIEPELDAEPHAAAAPGAALPARVALAEDAGAPRAQVADEALDRALSANRRELRGRVLSTSGAPMGFVLLEFEPRFALEASGEVVAISDAQGHFLMRGAQGPGTLRSGREDLITVCAAEVGAGEVPGELSVIVAESGELRGRVCDERGRALSEARVELLLPPELRASLGRRLEAASPYHPIVESDAQGRFAFEQAARIDGLELLVRREGFVPWRSQPSLERGELRVQLERPQPLEPGRGLRGRVLTLAGAPIFDARVALDGRLTRSATDGSFELEWQPDQRVEAPRVVALLPGSAPAFASAERGAEGGWVWPEPLELRLGAEPARLRGRVLDARGLPAPGILLWLADPSLLSVPSEDPEAGDLSFALPPDDQISARELPRIAESLAGGQRHRPWTSVRSAADGSFELGGLGARAYRIASLDPATLALREFGPFEAGRDALELRLDRERLCARLSGRVVAPDGVPLAGVQVALSRYAERIWSGRDCLLSRKHEREGTRTDLEGHFLLRDVPREDLRIELRGANILPATLSLSELDLDAGALELVALPDTRLRVELNDPQEADAFELLDAQGRALPLLIERGREWRTTLRARLANGRTEVLRAPLCAARLRLWRGASPLRELPLQLVAGEVNLLR